MNLTTINLPDTLTFVEPIIGFWDLREVAVTRLDDEGRLFTLRSSGTTPRRWFAVEPLHLFPDYTPDLPAETLENLQVTDPGQVQVLVIVNPDDPSGATANLLAPLVVNVTNGYAAQVVLDDDTRWPLSAPLPSRATVD